MTRSSRHKSHKQIKYSSKDYSDSEEDVKMKDKSGKNENLVRAYQGSTSGEKRKVLSQVREGRDGKDVNDHVNGEAPEDCVLSKRRKEKTDIGKERADVSMGVDGDRWNGRVEERGDTDRNVDKEINKGESLKIDSKLKGSNNKGESLRIESKTKSKRNENGSGGVCERKEDNLASLVVEKEENESKGTSKRKSDRDSSAAARKEVKESKDKDRVPEKEKRGGRESKRGKNEAKSVDVHFGRKQGSQLGDFGEERQKKRDGENTDWPAKVELRNAEIEKEPEKRTHRRREVSNVRDKDYDDLKESDERRLSSRDDRAKDVKYRDDRQKDGSYGDKYQEAGQKDDKHRDNKYQEEADKDSKHRGDKYQKDADRDVRRRDDRYREDGDRDSRRGDEKYLEDSDRVNSRKDNKYWEGTERDSRRRNDKYGEDGERDKRRRDDRYYGDVNKDSRFNDERYHEDGREDRHRDDTYREERDKDDGHKEDKHREDVERDNRHKEIKQGDDFDRERRLREPKYRDEHAPRDYSVDKSDTKHLRDDGYLADHHSRKSGAYDDSSKQDDQGRRKTNDKRDYDDIRSRSTKDQGFEADKKFASNVRMDLVPDRGRPISGNADVELASNHSRRRSSPNSSSHIKRGLYRLPKQEDSKHRDYAYEERVQYNVTSGRDYAGSSGGALNTYSSRSLEKLGLKEDGHLGDSSAERRLKSDIRSPPLRLVDKYPSSSIDRRYFSRSDARHNLAVEESAQRSGGLQDAKEYSGKEGSGKRKLVMDVLPGDEHLNVDDNLSASSPFARNSHLSNSSKSLLPPPPFRPRVDSPLISGFTEDDNRSRSNSNHRRIGNPNMGRVQGNALRGVPSWPSPVINGFMPFPHGPPPVGFHSVMQQFPAPPMFGVRPSMEINHPSPYHMPDSDRYSGPGRPMGWPSLMDDSRPPAMYVWDSSNPVFGEESQICGRPDWDHSRSLPGVRGWETSGDLWKGPYRTASTDMPSPDKENDFTVVADEVLSGQLIQQSQNEQTRPDKQAESTDISQSSHNLEKNSAEAPLTSPKGTNDIAKTSRKDDAPLFQFYLSKLDISADLTESELFNQCTGLSDIDQTIISDVCASNFFYMEEPAEAKVVFPNKTNFSLFSASNDSVFQRAMSLYKRQKKDSGAVNGELTAKIESISKSAEELNAEGNKNEKSPAGGMQDVRDDAFPKSIGQGCQVEEHTKAPHLQLDLPVVANIVEKSEPISASDCVNMEVELVSNHGPQEHIFKENPSSMEGVEKSDAHLSTGVEEVPVEFANNNKELKVLDNKCGPLLNSDVSPEACEGMMPESIESASVNLSRIHHSPESTH